MGLREDRRWRVWVTMVEAWNIRVEIEGQDSFGRDQGQLFQKLRWRLKLFQHLSSGLKLFQKLRLRLKLTSSLG